MRLMIAAGGTGGHVYPALAVAEAVRRRQPEAVLQFVGSVDGFERPLIAEGGVAFDSHDEVRAGPLHGVPWGRRLLSLAQMALGTLAAFRLLGARRPDVLLLTGGWVGLPVALAAWVRRVPALIFVPDFEPALSIRVLRRFARRVAITVPETARFFAAGQTVVTGYPLRAIMLAASRADAIAHFGLDAARPTLLVFGGSRGARSINNALLGIVSELLADGVQIVHITGTLDWDDVRRAREALPDPTHYHAFPYLHGDMGLAFAAADLVVSRAGASTLGEFPHCRLPSILVPYPHAWRYQKINADWLAQRGAALVMDDAALGETLLPTVRALLADPAALDAMREAAGRLAQPDSAGRIADELLRLAGENAL